MGPDNRIGGIVEAISFNDTLGEIGRVIEEGLSEDQVVLVSSIELYEVIADFRRMVKLGQTSRVDTKYKTMD